MNQDDKATVRFEADDACDTQRAPVNNARETLQAIEEVSGELVDQLGSTPTFHEPAD